MRNGKAIIAVRDLCLVGNVEITASVSVSGVSYLEVDIAERVEVGSEIHGQVKAFGSAGQQITIHPLMNIKPMSLDDGIRVT